MKILFNPIEFRQDNEKKNNSNKSNTIINHQNTTNLSKFPNYNYLINFGANNDSLKTLYEHYGAGKGMPVTYDLLLSNMSNSERANIKEVFAHYRSVYDEMENCHTVEELKEKFPQEFSNLKSALTIQSRKNSFLNKFNDLSVSHSQDDEYIFPETNDNDLTVYLAKKIYLESKTKKEIDNDFYKDLSKIVYTEEDYQKEFPLENGSIIPLNIYKELGLTSSKESTGFRHSLLCSRDNYIREYGSVYKSKRKETFNNFVETVTSSDKIDKRRIPQKNSANYEKYRYAMFLAWNNSINLRIAMSDYLIRNKAGNELLTPDIISINSSSDEENMPLQSMMRGFWQRNPELRKQFSTTCTEAFEKIEEAIDNGTFEDFKKEIEEERNRVYQVLAEQKADKELEIATKKAEQEQIRIMKEINAAVRKHIIESLHNLASRKPIPKSLFGETVDKIHSMVPKVENNILSLTDTIVKTVDIMHDIEDNSIGNILRDVCFHYLKKKPNKPKNKNTETNYTDIYMEATKMLINMPQYISITMNDASCIHSLLNEKMVDIIPLFLDTILNDYAIYILNHKTNNMTEDKREKIINEIYEKVKETDSYKNLCVENIKLTDSEKCDAKIQAFLFEQLVRVLKEIEPNEFVKQYEDMYKKQILGKNTK